MMGPTLYWLPPRAEIPGRLAISARPRGGDWLADEVAGWKKAGVTLVVSLLTEVEEHHFDLTLEADECAAHGLDFVSIPVADRGIPDDSATFAESVSGLGTRLAAGDTIAIHCRQGIGRSALLAATILISLGARVDEAVQTVSLARGLRTPETPEQSDWLHRFHPVSSLPTGLS